jgi:HK97 family phage major capsid protein
MTPGEAFAAYLRTGRSSPELRAMGEATNSAGGFTVAPTFADSVIRVAQEFDGFIADVEDLPTADGASWKRPQVSALVASSAALAENTQDANYGGDATGAMTQVTFAGQQSFGLCPVIVTRLAMSRQLMEDANVDPAALLASAAGEAIGREAATLGNAALYAAATTGQEVSLTTLTAAKLAGLIAKVDPAYLPGSKFYMSAGDYAIAAISTGVVPNGPREFYGFPVVITNAATAFSSGTVSGPVFGNLGRFMSMRRAGGLGVQVLRERYADYSQVAVNVYARIDFAARGEAASVAFSK